MACVVQPGNPGGFQKVFFGREEVAIPVQGTVQEAVKAYPRADVFINFASFRRCRSSPSFRCIIVELRCTPGCGDEERMNAWHSNALLHQEPLSRTPHDIVTADSLEAIRHGS